MTKHTTTISLPIAWANLRKGEYTMGMLLRSKESLIWESLPSHSEVKAIRQTVNPLVFEVDYIHTPPGNPEDDMDEPLGQRTCSLDDDECTSCQ